MDRVATAIAADQVEEAVDVAEAVLDLRGPVVGGGNVEQVHGVGVDAVVRDAEIMGDSVRDLLVPVREGERGVGVCETLGDDGAEAAAGPGNRDHSSVEL